MFLKGAARGIYAVARDRQHPSPRTFLPKGKNVFLELLYRIILVGSEPCRQTESVSGGIPPATR